MSHPPDGSYSANVEFAVLGQLRVRGPLGPLHLPSAKERVVLAHLIARAGQVVTADELIDSLWDGSPPRTASKSLQNYVLRLRNTLEPDRAGSPAVLVTDGPGYRLSVADDAIDARRFVRLVELGRRAYRDGRVEASAATLGEALALWYGPAYAGFESTGFGGGESRRLEELRLSAIEDRIAADVDLGRARDTVPELEALVHDHPLRERLWSLLVHALYHSGRQADALATYARARAVLVEELGVDPGDELQELYARVLAHDQTLLAQVPVPVVPDSLLPAPGPFVGREQELARLRDAWELARAGSSPLIVVIRGSRGAGARRLVGELALAVAEQGGRVVHHTQRAPTAADGEEGPVLTVLTGDAATQSTASGPCGPGLTVLLRGPSAPVPPASEVIDLAPLTSADVRTLLASYIDDDAAVDAALAQVERESGGLPGRVQDAALRVARRRAAVLVDEAAARTGRIHEALDEARDDLRDGVSAYREVLERQTPAEPGQCPWKGLASYQVVDSSWFAGRERLVAELVARLSSTSLLAVVGASGSGKSSLVHAGLLAALESGALPGSEGWTRLVMRPGPHPMRELVRVALRGADTGRDRVAKALEQMVYGDDDAAGAVLVVDQLEETWTSCGAPEEREAFLDALSEIADSDAGFTVVLVVRADYVGRLADRPGLVRALADATVLVGAPTEPELRRAVEHPAQRAGLHLDIGLADALVADAAGGPGLLPLLSTALTELWDHRDGRRLTLAAYATAGGIRGAVARLAERAFGVLDPLDQAATRVLLLRLAGPGEGAGVTRRRVPLADLAALPDPRVSAVVDSLADARLLSLDAGHVEVAHEALFREWPRLRGWLEEDVAARAVQRRLVDAATDWDTGGREPSEVWRGTRLAGGADFAAGHPDEVTSVERAFLDAGEARQDAERREAEDRAAAAGRQNRRLRGLLGGVGVLLVTALVAGVLAVQAGNRAEREARVATARELAAASVAELGSDPELSTLLALESIDVTRSEDGSVLTEAEDALHRAVTSSRIVMTVPGVGGALDVSPAGDVFVTEGPEQSGVIDLRDAATGESLRSWPGHDPDVNHVAFSPDGSVLATAGDDGAVRVWDPATGAQLMVSRGPGREAWGPSFSPDGALLAAIWPESGIVRVIDVATQRTLHKIRLEGVSVATSFSPDGRRLAIAMSNPGGTLVVDLVSGGPPARLVQGEWDVLAVAWSPDGSWVAAGGLDGVIRVWLADTGDVAHVLSGHSGTIYDLDWSRDSTRLATASDDGTARVWEVRSEGARELLQVSGWSTSSGVGGVAFSPDGAHLLTGNGSPSPTTVIWDVGLGGDEEWATFPAPPDAFNGVGFTPDGLRLFTAAEDGSAAGWDVASGEELVRTGSHGTPEDPESGGNVSGLDVSPDGSLVATAGDGSGGGEAAWSPDGEFLATVGRTRVWDAVTGVEAFSVPSGGEPGTTVVVDRSGVQVAELHEAAGLDVDSLAFSPDGSLLATGTFSPVGERTRLTVWDWRRAEAVTERELPGYAAALAFDPTGTLLATADPDGPATVWDAATGQEVATLAGHRAGVWDVAFSPDGSYVATGSRDGTVRLWDPATGVSRLELDGHTGPVWSVRFSQDGTRLASSGAEGTVRVWALDLDDLIDLARRELTRSLSDAECQQYLHVDRCPDAEP
jgi:WD40 repeat protein/DNA-binding SARP family transcriptional activator